MEEGSGKTIEEIYALEKENNKMLRSIKRSMAMARVAFAVRWAVIIGISIGAFYFLQPYVDQLMETYKNISASFQDLQNIIK